MKTLTMKPFYSPSQTEALNVLQPILRLATSPFRSDLPLSTRTHTLITGPSGSGKSHLAKALSKEAKLPLWEANVSSWIVLGARNGNPTLVSLVDWIHQNSKGIIFLDELEKPFPNQIGGSTDSSWFNSVKMEIHDLTDGRIPEGAIHLDSPALAESYGDQMSPRDYKALVKFDVEIKLRNSFFIIGAGTWQHLWTENGNGIGFNIESSPIVSLDYNRLLKSISPELLLRFRQQVLFLRPMTSDDFHSVLREQIHLVPVSYRDRYIRLVRDAIPRAVELGLGMRIFEEIFTDLCCEVIHNSAGDPEVCRDILVERGHAR